ncbi:MAG: ABC transporter ATP-binding protein [Myxococcota bacterium]
MTRFSEYESSGLAGSGQPALRRLLAYARPFVPLILVAMLLGAGLSATHAVRAYLIKPVLDDVVMPGAELTKEGTSLDSVLPSFGLGNEAAEPAAPPVEPTPEQRARLEELMDSLGQVVAIALAIIVLAPLFMYFREVTVQYVLGRVDLAMKVDICAKVLALPLSFHQSRQRGDTVQRILGDASGAHRALDLLFGDFLESVLMIVVGAFMLFYISWKLALVTLVVGPVIALVIGGFSSSIRRNARKRQEQSADVTQRLLEILAGIKVVKSFRAEEQENQAFEGASHKLFRRSMKVVRQRVLARSLIDGLNQTVIVGVILFGVWLVLSQRWGLTMGDLAAFVGVTATLYRPVRTISRGWVRVIDSLPAAERFFEVIDAPVEIRDDADAVAIDRHRDSVRFENVSFSYGREPVLHDICLDVKAGEVVAIVGRTGSGKTTLTDLLLRLYDPQQGRITSDGVDLRHIQRDSLLDQTAVVTQDPFLFDGSIRENILYGRPDASDDEVMSAARAAHVDEFASQLAEGYETEVGVSGALLSGGQRQRITLARAILRDPAILILDEATSSLDSKAERYVQEALEALLPGRTVFVIAHRLSTVRNADRIVVVEDGRITQSGTHEELVARGGLYRELVALQNQAGDAGAVN